ncbi:MAG TPA: trimethylamine methyltransferase family protein [Terriglobales bacterium]|jgi:trimethylamine--corrinoid protein Co-methyltransferase
MRPKLQLLDSATVERVIAEAFQLLQSPGIKVGSAGALDLLKAAGAKVNDSISQIPRSLAEDALASVPRRFYLYDGTGNAAVAYGGDAVHFDPGSSCLNILDPRTQKPRPALSADLIRMVQVAETLPQFAAQSTAMVCNDVPSTMGDWYRLLLVLWYSNKPVVTGAFSTATLQTMLELLTLASGGSDNLRRKPRAVFDVCPSPPLNWSDFASENLIQLARSGVPAEIVSMPLAGATAPVTLAGSIVQHAAECLGGITIHQLACPGAPIVWGGAPAILDMSTGNTPMGSIETTMLNLGCAEVGKSLGLPTHGYMVASDSRFLDAQAGLESGGSTLLGALTGINMISGAGMLDFLACHSVEKLIFDAEAIGYAQRLIAGIDPRGESLAVDTFTQVGLGGEFLKLKETRVLFHREQHFPSAVIDRATDVAQLGIDSRLKTRVAELLANYQPAEMAPAIREQLLAFAIQRAYAVGLSELPGVAEMMAGCQ